ncbi:MAG: hypothetical protein DI535_24295 [Citrobacter freundii]|nr:MAG: hypothetical protein DI535_24295 [Citrobacter freundii]
MRRLPLMLCFVLIVLTNDLFAQEFEPPANPVLEKKDDYLKYETDIINAARWLEATPIGAQKEKRVRVNMFFTLWLTGSPTVTVEINSWVMKLTDKNPDLLTVFLSGYARYVLENQYSNDAAKANEAGVKSMINNYQLGGDVKKNKTLQKAVDADKAGNLTAWMKDFTGKK